MIKMEDEEFSANVVWDGQTGARIHVGKFRGLRLDMPIKFGGKERYPCPDELFLSSVAGCLLTTLIYFVKRWKVKLEGLKISIIGTLRAGSDGYRISAIRAMILAKAKKSQESNVRKCIDLTKEYCHITRALEKVVPIEITEKIETVTKPRSK